MSGDTSFADVFVRDRQEGTTERVSEGDSGDHANGDSSEPSISEDGRLVVFSSNASNLVPGDSNGAQDIFVYDRLAGTTERVSVGNGSVQANQPSFDPMISADGAS